MSRADETKNRNNFHCLLTQQQVADIYGVSRAAIYNVEQRALGKLRAALSREARHRGMTVRQWLFGED